MQVYCTSIGTVWCIQVYKYDDVAQVQGDCHDSNPREPKLMHYGIAATLQEHYRGIAGTLQGETVVQSAMHHQSCIEHGTTSSDPVTLSSLLSLGCNRAVNRHSLNIYPRNFSSNSTQILQENSLLVAHPAVMTT